MRQNMNRTLHHCYFNWIDSSIIMNLQSNILTLRDLGLPGLESALAQTQVSQALTTQWLLTNADFPCFRLVLSRRLAYFFNPGTFEHLIPGLVEAYRLGNKVFKPAIIAAHLKACCNAWVTRRRFGDPAGFCFFCGNGPDDISHLLACDSIRQIMADCLGGDMIFSLDHLLLFHSREQLFPPAVIELFFFYVYIVFRLHNCCRHGEKLSRRLFYYVCKHASLHCLHFRSIFIRLRAEGVPS